MWKIENRNLRLYNSESCYGEYNIKGSCFGLMQWIERITRDKEKLLKVHMIDGAKDNFFAIKFVNDYLWWAIKVSFD